MRENIHEEDKVALVVQAYALIDPYTQTVSKLKRKRRGGERALRRTLRTTLGRGRG